MRSQRFALEIYWRGERCKVSGTAHSGTPARLSGPPDTWSPAEPAEVDFDDLPPGVLDDDLPDFADRVLEVLSEEYDYD